jgi:hypothetical protein
VTGVGCLVGEVEGICQAGEAHASIPIQFRDMTRLLSNGNRSNASASPLGKGPSPLRGWGEAGGRERPTAWPAEAGKVVVSVSCQVLEG